MQTKAKVVLFTTETAFLLSSFGLIVKIRAKATEPLIIPAKETTARSLLLIFHFFLKIFLKMKERPKMAISLENTQIASYKNKKEKEMT